MVAGGYLKPVIFVRNLVTWSNKWSIFLAAARQLYYMIFIGKYGNNNFKMKIAFLENFGHNKVCLKVIFLRISGYISHTLDFLVGHVKCLYFFKFLHY